MKFLIGLEVLLFFISADAGVSMNNPFYCYTSDSIRPSITMHSSSTSYEAVRHFNFTTLNPYISSCTASKFWYHGNYGNRLPFAATIPVMLGFANSSLQADIERNYEAGRTTLCRQDLEAIRDWNPNPNFTVENAELVTEAGKVAMQNIARRYQKMFPNILTKTYSRERFYFRHTALQRSNTSIRAFASGLFGKSGSQNVIYENIPDVDWLLRPADNCPKYFQQLDYTEKEAFKRGPEIEQMLDEINRKLGFHGSNQLSYDTIRTMWNWCRYETMATFETSNSEIGDNSPWCAAFSIAHHHLLQYDENLSRYYFLGHGFRDQRFLKNLICGLLQDLVNHMKSDKYTGQKARIFVSFFQEVGMVLYALGAFKEVWPPHRHNFAQKTETYWVSSLTLAMASNLVAVRYDCDNGDDDLVFYMSERPILVPGCDQQTGACKLDFIVKMFQRFSGANCAKLFCTSD